MELTLFLFWAFVMLLNALFAVKADLVALNSLFWKLAVPSRAGTHDQMDKKSGIWQFGRFFFFCIPHRVSSEAISSLRVKQITHTSPDTRRFPVSANNTSPPSRSDGSFTTNTLLY